MGAFIASMDGEIKCTDLSEMGTLASPKEVEFFLVVNYGTVAQSGRALG